MITVTAIFRPFAKTKCGNIYYKLIVKNRARYIRSIFTIEEQEWRLNGGKIELSRVSPQRFPQLKAYSESIKIDIARLRYIAESLGEEVDIDSIVDSFYLNSNKKSISVFTMQIIEQLAELRKIRLVETYAITITRLMSYTNGRDILLTSITPAFVLKFEAYLKWQGLTMNTISFYMRILRAIYNRAVDAELTKQLSPFRKVYTGVDKTRKRGLCLKDIQRIKSLDLSLRPRMAYARDLFMLSFYTRGMSFVDMAYLRKSDMHNDTISYRRRKTQQQLYIKWEQPMQDIINRYPRNETQYLLPIITECDLEERAHYQRVLASINFQLRAMTKLLKMQQPLTMYVARHTWASIAKCSNVPLGIISAAMGHDSERTTEIYLATLDSAIVDSANRKILKLLSNG